MKLIRFLNDSNLLAAIAAASLTAGTFIIAASEIYFLLVGQSFFLTWAAYLFLKNPEIRFKKSMIYIATTGSAICLVSTHFFAWPILIAAALPVLLYKPGLLLPQKAKARFALRNIPFVKSIAIGISWALLTSAVPAATADDASQIPFAFMIYSNFFFVAALAMSGDIRDSDLDINQLKTAPAVAGIKWTKIISIIMIAISALIFFAIPPLTTPKISIAFYALMLCSMVMVINLHPKKDWQVQAFFIDAIMIARFMAIAIAAYL